MTTVDAQPIPQSSGLMVYTTGKKMVRHSPPARPLPTPPDARAPQVEGEEKELPYSHIFHLLPQGGSYWVQNEMFRINVG